MARLSVFRSRRTPAPTRLLRDNNGVDLPRCQNGFVAYMTAGPENEQVSQGQATTVSAPSSTPSQLVTALKRDHPEWLTDVVEALGQSTAVVLREHIVEVCSFLKSRADSQFDFLADLCGVDQWP